MVLMEVRDAGFQCKLRKGNCAERPDQICGQSSVAVSCGGPDRVTFALWECILLTKFRLAIQKRLCTDRKQQ